jgi:hypothetical protein
MVIMIQPPAGPYNPELRSARKVSTVLADVREAESALITAAPFADVPTTRAGMGVRFRSIARYMPASGVRVIERITVPEHQRPRAFW